MSGRVLVGVPTKLFVRAVNRLRLGWAVGCFFLFCSGLVATAAPEPTKVYVAFSLHEVTLPMEPGAYLRARVDFWWDPVKDPNFSPDSVQFFNAIKTVDRQRVTGGADPLPPPEPGYAHGAILITGNFKTYSDYSDFPFDTHEIGIMLYLPERPPESVRFVSRPDYLRKRFSFGGQADGLEVRSINFYPESTGFREFVPSDKNDQAEAFCAITLEISRSLPPYFVRILLPMFIIWALSYMSHFWRDSSPASRFSASAMIAAVALTLGVRGLIPPFNYLMAVNVAFLGLFACIAFDAIITAAVFFVRGSGKIERSEKIRRVGIILSPVLALCALMSSWYISSHKIRDDLFTEPPSVSVDTSGIK